MNNILIIMLAAVLSSVFMWYLLSILGFDVDRGLIGGITGAIVGSNVSSYLNKKN